MNEILQKRIEEAARNYADSLALPEWDKRSIHAIDFKKGAVAALHNQWISVDEALPEFEEDVLVTNGDNDYFITWRSEDSVDIDEHGFVNYNVFKITNWMPIPELPKGGGK